MEIIQSKCSKMSNPTGFISRQSKYFRKGLDGQGKQTVIAIVNMKICENLQHHQLDRFPEHCDDLHLCKFYILTEQCPGISDKTCTYNHSLNEFQSHHNSVLQKHCLEGLDIYTLQGTLRNVWPEKISEIEKILAAKEKAKIESSKFAHPQGASSSLISTQKISISKNT